MLLKFDTKSYIYVVEAILIRIKNHQQGQTSFRVQALRDVKLYWVSLKVNRVRLKNGDHMLESGDLDKVRRGGSPQAGGGGFF